MQVPRLRLLVVGLAGLCLLAGIALLVTVLNGTGHEPIYRGKPLSLWFREYAFSSNAPVQTVSARIQPGGQMVLTQIRGGTQVRIVGPTNSAALAAWLRVQMPPSLANARDPAWDALQAIGSNAVPYLIGQLRGIPFEPTYRRAFTNLPALLQKKLPHPGERHYLRVRALNALSSLGDPDGLATPALLELLRKRDRFLQFAVYEALRKSCVDRRLISQVLLELGAKGRNDDVLEIAEQVGWEGDDTARLLGTILKSPDAAERRRTIVLLERSGPAAASAHDAVLMALSNSDTEVRYMSARALEAMGASSAEVADALRASLNDSNVMVQTVARQMLLKISSETIGDELK